MGSANAARRRVQEARPPDAAAVIAELGRINAEGAAIHARMRRLDGEVSRITARLDELAQGDDGDRFALLADKLASRLAVLVTELMADAAHCEEARRQAEALAPLLAFTPAMFEAAVLEGRRREAEERDQAPRARPPRARHARGRHLKLAPSIPATAARAVAAAAVVAGLSGAAVAGMHEESAVSAVAAAPARHAALQRMAPDRAVVVPSWSPRARFSPSSRPSPAVASASPAPVVTPGLPFPQSPAGPPPPLSPPAVVPALAVPRLLDLGATTRGPLTLTAGPQAVTWTVGTADGITVLAGGRPVTGGTLAAGQELDLTVMAPLGEGWVYVSAGQQTWTVEITSDLGVPALALP